MPIVTMAVLEELPVKQRAPKGNIIERLLFDCPLENARSWTRESSVTSGHFFQRIRLYYGVKIGYASGGFAAVCMSYLNTNLIIIASLPHNFRIQLPNRSLNLHLPIATCHLQDYWAYNSVVVNLDVAEPSSNQQHQRQNLLAAVGDSSVNKSSGIRSFQSCVVNTLKSLRHLPLSSYSNTRGDKIPKQAGVGKFKDLTKNNFKCSPVHASWNEKGRSRLNKNSALKVKKEYVLLPAAALLATVLFTAACRFPRFITKANYIYDYDTGRIVHEERDSTTITSSFILFNSTGFIASLAIVISILRGFPLKPWPQISVSMLFGSYMCLIMKILPLESWLILFLSVPLLLLAAAGKLCDFGQ
ncbi:uncharacterized protein LOC132615980 [Lycium barbarum]|uniref:uncharacterized protein LOC132615980 n=1 Tax=Lycium barbarum TaxID=112863 RepID=UPI00293F7845|nr:uncharacterized protein LOC132615980 [Lycium barbarum]XP_060186563.1 uncharacterized protein LOC132615980 [Lycium barbarum]